MVSDLREDLLAFRAKLLPARNKFISHSDRAAIIAGVPLGGGGEAEWNQFWLNLQELVQIMHARIVGGGPFYLNGVAMSSDAQNLLQALQRFAQ
jgi:hypothetical protein